MDKYDQIRKKTVEKTIPFNVDWELTHRCNLLCKHCYQCGPDLNRQEVNIEEIAEGLKQLKELGTLFITFSGGEVFLREDIFEILELTREFGMAYRIFTNATILDKTKMDRLIKLKPLSVEMSIYSMNPSIHDGITKIKGSLDKTKEAAEYLRKNNVNVKFKSVVFRENMNEFRAMENYAKKIQASFNFYIGAIPRLDGDKKGTMDNLSSEQVSEFLRTMNFQKEEFLKIRREGDYRPLCFAGKNGLYISPYGDVFPCVTWRIKCGNIRQNSLRDIWTGTEFNKLRKISFDDLKDCNKCDLVVYCNRCPGTALIESKNTLARSEHDCLLAKARRDV